MNSISQSLQEIVTRFNERHEAIEEKQKLQRTVFLNRLSKSEILEMCAWDEIFLVEVKNIHAGNMGKAVGLGITAFENAKRHLMK